MSYRVNRSLGYQPWGVVNPYVFADLSQPQRGRNGVSPYVWQTHPPQLARHPMGQVPVSSEAARSDRMERYAIAGLALSALSFGFFVYKFGTKRAA